MAVKDVAITNARSRTVWEGGIETVVIPVRRTWFALIFLPVWLTLWTLGGAMAIYEFSRQFQLFLLVWLIGWAMGWIYAASSIVWQIAGRETIRIEGNRLVHGCHAPLWNRELAYDTAEIRGLSPDRGPSMFESFQFATPLFVFGRMGVIKFHYGAKTVRIGIGIDEAEGRQIVDWLAARLPASAKS